jgi:hypothetical protein
MVKLYKEVDGKLHYHEAWVHNGNITEHWGVVGELGQTQKHKLLAEWSEDEGINSVLKGALDDGFQPVELEQHAVLFIEYAISGYGTREDLDKQNRLQERMDEILGWSGLGHCDGGSRGIGTMQVCCLVVDYDTARRLIQSALRASEFADYSRIYREDNLT